MRRGNPRKPTNVKVYAAVFVCFVTKAVHFELCSDLTSDVFIAAFNRFCGRRGTPSDVFIAAFNRFCGRRGTPSILCSDNGTNFIGAKRELHEVRTLLEDPQTHQSLSHISTSSGMKWKLTPPRSPHFGGLWESAVKAMKTTLKKLLSSRPLTFEKLDTLLVESEAILNSRPLAPVTSTYPD